MLVHAVKMSISITMDLQGRNGICQNQSPDNTLRGPGVRRSAKSPNTWKMKRGRSIHAILVCPHVSQFGVVGGAYDSPCGEGWERRVDAQRASTDKRSSAEQHAACYIRENSLLIDGDLRWLVE